LAVNGACRLLCSRHAPPPAVKIIDSQSSSERGSPSDQGRFLRPFTWVLAGGLKHLVRMERDKAQADVADLRLLFSNRGSRHQLATVVSSSSTAGFPRSRPC